MSTFSPGLEPIPGREYFTSVGCRSLWGLEGEESPHVKTKKNGKGGSHSARSKLKNTAADPI